MSPYAIFVVCLTIGYIIYFGYNISKDVYGKKATSDSNDETFEVSSEEPVVVAVPVREVGSGFSLGDKLYESPADADGTPTTSPTNLKIESARGLMEEADVQSEGGIDNFELRELLNNIDQVKSTRNIKVHRDRF